MGLKGFAAGSSFGDVFTEAEKQGLVTMVVGNDEFFRRHRRNNTFTAKDACCLVGNTLYVRRWGNPGVTLNFLKARSQTTQIPNS